MNPPSIRRALSLLPSCGTTGIGSLPHTQLELALQTALQTDIPYLPQLPHGNPSELMIPAALDGFPGLSFDTEGLCTIDVQTWERERQRLEASLSQAFNSGDFKPFEPGPIACRAWKPFVWEVENRKLAFAKAQIAGPLTVRWVTRTSTGAPTSDLPALDQQIFRLVFAKAMAIGKALRATGSGTTPIVFLDEPGLYALNTKNPVHLVALQELKMVALALQREGVLVGVHCCSNTQWSALLDLDLDILSLDVRLSLDAVLDEKEALARFLAELLTLSLGLVPTNMNDSFDLKELVGSVETGFRSVSGDRYANPALARCLVTPACGLAMRSVIDAERILGQVKDAQRALLWQVSEGAPQPHGVSH